MDEGGRGDLLFRNFQFERLNLSPFPLPEIWLLLPSRSTDILREYYKDINKILEKLSVHGDLLPENPSED